MSDKNDIFDLPEDLTYEVIFADTLISVDGKQITVGDFYNEVVDVENYPDLQLRPCLKQDDIYGKTDAEKQSAQEIIEKIEQCTTDKEADPNSDVLTIRREELVGNPEKHIRGNGKVEFQIDKSQRLLGVILPDSKNVLLLDKIVSNHGKDADRHLLLEKTCKRIYDFRYARFMKGLKDYRQAVLSGQIAKLAQRGAVEIIALLESKHDKKPVVDDVVDMIELLNDPSCNGSDRKEFTEEIVQKMKDFSTEDWQTLFHTQTEKKEMDLLKTLSKDISDSEIKKVCNRMTSFYEEYLRHRDNIGYDEDAQVEDKNKQATRINQKYNAMRKKMDDYMRGRK